MLFYVETLLYISFHTLILMNSTNPSTIWDRSSTSYARALAKNSVSVAIQAPPIWLEFSTFFLLIVRGQLETQKLCSADRRRQI